MATVDSIKVIAYQREYTKMSNKYVDTPVFVAGSGEYSIMAANNSYIEASGVYSYAEGYDTIAEGDYSHVEGEFSTARGGSSHSEGYQSWALGISSHAEGGASMAAGDFSHSEGNQTAAIGIFSHAEGYGLRGEIYLTGNNGTYSFPSWCTGFQKGSAVYNVSDGTSAIITSIDQTNHTLQLSDSLGKLNDQYFLAFSNCALGNSSHTEGSSNAVLSDYSHAEGLGNTVSGQASHAEGSYTIASGTNQHVAGKYNVEDSNNTYAEIIGIGTAESSRKNGRTLDWYGNEQLVGSLTLGLGTTDQVTVTAAQLKQLLAITELSDASGVSF